jgi:hypothetical protein
LRLRRTSKLTIRLCERLLASTGVAHVASALAQQLVAALRGTAPLASSGANRILMLTSWSEVSTPPELSRNDV